jgi:hypothetical protein
MYRKRSFVMPITCYYSKDLTIYLTINLLTSCVEVAGLIGGLLLTTCLRSENYSGLITPNCLIRMNLRTDIRRLVLVKETCRDRR